MNKSNALVIGLVIVGVLAVVGFLLLGRSSNSDKSSPQEISTTQSDSQMVGRYVEYKSGTLEMNKDKRRVLYFYANWCPTCRPADANFKANVDKIPEDVVVVRVNYDDSDTDEEEEQLADKYGITYQHTFVEIDGDGKEVQKWNGGAMDELLSRLQ